MNHEEILTSKARLVEDSFNSSAMIVTRNGLLVCHGKHPLRSLAPLTLYSHVP